MEAFLRRSLLLFALLAGTAAGVAPAAAADNGMPPEFRSSDFEVYLGAFGGANMMQSTYQQSETIDPPFGYLDGNLAAYGVRAGVDYNMDSWVIGAVADWSFGAGAKIARDAANSSELDMPNLATIRARAGYAAGSALFYITGGFATAEMSFEINDEVTGLSGSDNDWAEGWTMGAGVDVDVTQNVSVGVEYLYLSLDDMKYKVSDDAGTVTFEQDIEAMHTIRLGVNYAFSI
jgi:opacity protein-like surface antigen